MRREYIIKLIDEEKEPLRESELIDLNMDTMDDHVVNHVIKQSLEYEPKQKKP